MFDKFTRRPIFTFEKDEGAGDPPDGDNTNAGDKGGDEQEKLNKQFADRAKRASEAERKKLYESLGVKDDAEFEAFLKSKKETEDKNKSEVQRLADEAKAAKERADKLEADKKAAMEAMQKRVLDTEIKVAASAEVKDKDGKVTRAAFRPEALSDILLLVDRSKIEEKEGEFTGIDKALAELAKAKPYLLIDPKAQPSPKGTPRQSNKTNQNASSDDGEDDLGFKSL